MTKDKFKELRIKLRHSSRKIIHNILENHLDPENNAGLTDICIFCGDSNDLTNEHVLPKWVFEGDPLRYFVTKSNQLSQTFNRSTVPACVKCNTAYLSNIEKYIQGLLSRSDLDTSATYFELIDILRWMEIIEYKFHVLEFRRKFKASKKDGYNPILANVPLSILRRSIKYSAYKAVAELRKSQRQITVKNKDPKFHSLVIFELTDPESHFIHSMNSFLFFSLPQYNKALFYFINMEFDDYSTATEEAKMIIKHIYEHERNH